MRSTRLIARAKRRLATAREQLGDLSLTDVSASAQYHFSSASRELAMAAQRLAEIDLDKVRFLERRRGQAVAEYDWSARQAIEASRGSIRALQDTGGQLAAANLRRFDELSSQAERSIRGAVRALTLLRMPRSRRILYGMWPVLVLIAAAILAAMLYFLLNGSAVDHPLSSEGIKKVSAKAVEAPREVARAGNMAADPISALTKIVEELEKLFSAVPALLVAFAGALAAIQKFRLNSLASGD